MNKENRRTIIIKGLKDEGPGDILGAITSKTDVSGDAIGEMDLGSPETYVQVDRNVARDIVAEMDDNRIGSSRVEVSLEEETDAKPASEEERYVEKWKRLVEQEREEEMREHRGEIRDMSPRERQSKGRALLNMRGRDVGEDLGGYHVKFLKMQKDQELPDLDMSVGDLVMVSKKDPLRDDNPSGTITEITNYSLTVSFPERPSGFVFGKHLRLDLYVNDITYQRMLDALEEGPRLQPPFRDLWEVVSNQSQPTSPDPEDVQHGYNEDLNHSQWKAVRNALGADTLFLIHGPPGTGKTTTLIEVIRQHLRRGKFILATADSNTAVDNMMEELINQGVYAVRVGHPARVTPTITRQTLASLVEQNDTYREAMQIKERAFDMKEEQDDLTHPSGRYRRGMSDEKIKQLAREGRGSRGVPASRIEEMAQWLHLQEKADSFFEKADRLEEEAIQEILDSADVICTTNSTAGSQVMENRHFDVLALDEATQATEPSCLIPMMKSRKAILAGDHHQLPPTIKNKQAAEEGLERTLFEKMADLFGDRLRTMLKIQYRMHRDIMAFSSERFYGGTLEADETVRDHTLADFDLHPPENLSDEEKKIWSPEHPIVFVNTRNLKAEEQSREGSTSRENPVEANLTVTIAEHFLQSGLDPEDIAVITPYSDQVDLIEENLDRKRLEVDSVDGFQGREKEIILISLVRSNMMGQVGFLREERRFNVALTRARRKAVVIGDESTIASEELFGDFLDYMQNRGTKVQPEEVF